MSNTRSIYPRLFHLNSPQLLSFMHVLDKPLQRPTIEVALIDCGNKQSEIDYSQINKMECVQVGIHPRDKK